MKRQTDLSFAVDSSWRLDDIDEWLTFAPPSKRARRVSTAKSVRFAPEDEVSYRHISNEDLTNAWYTPSDWKGFRAECRKLVAFIAKCNGDLSCLDEKRHCIRGLEEYISASLLRRSSPQRLIVRQVVLVQQWQRKQGIKDQAALRNAYLRLSQKHRYRALRRGAGDVNPLVLLSSQHTN